MCSLSWGAGMIRLELFVSYCEKNRGDTVGEARELLFFRCISVRPMIEWFAQNIFSIRVYLAGC